VSDTGIGIPADELPNVFSEFFRAQNAKRAQITGTGIGLSTVHALVERYNGHISLDSEEGKGTIVTVTLPLAPDQTLSIDTHDEM
jgi:two-component system phosphate regulon sensor histidine kinase PhoR